MYKLLTHEESHSAPTNVSKEQEKVGKENLYRSIDSAKDFTHNIILPTYYDYFDELCALARSKIHLETTRKKLCLITNRNISDEEKQNIQDLYFDHDFCVNEYSNDIDYFFLNSDSFSDEELQKIYNKLSLRQ